MSEIFYRILISVPFLLLATVVFTWGATSSDRLGSGGGVIFALATMPFWWVWLRPFKK